jgi:predicted transcriptional regulator
VGRSRLMAKNPSKLPRLGELELAVLEHLWIEADADVHEAHAAIGQRRGISPNTVGSALERLYKKGLLTREKVSHAYRYRAAIDRENFQAQRVVEAAGGLRSLGKSGLLAAFVDLVADSDEAALLELERLIRLKREESGT